MTAKTLIHTAKFVYYVTNAEGLIRGKKMLLIDVAIGWILYTLSAPLWVWVIFIFGAVLED